MKITFLGTGTSHGIPMINCRCAVCRSRSPKNKRLRPSALIGLDSGENILIDTAPDLRQQSLANNVRRIDAVLLTHAHNDHTNGLDDLRGFTETNNTTIACFAMKQTVESVKRRFDYAFKTPARGLTVPRVSFHSASRPFMLLGERVIPIPVLHGKLPIFGYRIGAFAYITDCKTIPAPSFAMLEGLDTLVIDALRRRPHPTHMCLSETLAAIKRIGPRRAFLTHICHDLEHRALCRELPAHVRPAYDGLVLDI